MKKKYLILLLVAFLLVVFAFFAPSFLTRYCSEYENCGQIGDTIGGLMNPFISIAAVIVTGLAFYAQYEANQKIETQIKNEKIEKIESHEYNKYLDFLKMSYNELNYFEFRYSPKDKNSNDYVYNGVRAIVKLLKNDFTKNFSYKYDELIGVLEFFKKNIMNIKNNDKLSEELKKDLLDFVKFILNTKLNVLDFNPTFEKSRAIVTKIMEINHIFIYENKK